MNRKSVMKWMAALLLWLAGANVGLHAQDLTPERILRVVQERHTLLEQKRWLAEAEALQMKTYLLTGEMKTFEQLVGHAELTPVEHMDWPHVSEAYPPDGALDSLNLAQILEIFNLASTTYETMRVGYLNVPYVEGAYDPANAHPDTPEFKDALIRAINRATPFTPDDLPPVGRFTPENYGSQLVELADRLRYLFYVEWHDLQYQSTYADIENCSENLKWPSIGAEAFEGSLSSLRFDLMPGTPGSGASTEAGCLDDFILLAEIAYEG